MKITTDIAFLGYVDGKNLKYDIELWFKMSNFTCTPEIKEN